MDDAEAKGLRREILHDVGAILREQLAAETWGRSLVEVVRSPDGQPVVSGIDVEEVIGDERRVDEVFGGEGARAVLPVLAKAVEALCALDRVDIADVRGGTFIRLEDERFAWLPGLVHAPSPRLDRERDGLLAKLRAKNDALATRYGFPTEGRLNVDLGGETVALARASRQGICARATLVGTFAPPSRMWGWGGSNPHVPDRVRRASATLVDEILDRDMWELSTPAFASDEPTAWTLAALVCDRAGGDGIFCGPEQDGMVFVLLRDARVV
jgi:hypothetical protein